MDKKLTQDNKAIRKIASKKALDENAAAFRAYDAYKEASEIIERSDVASGKRVVFRSSTGSAINFQIDLNGTYSTTAQKI